MKAECTEAQFLKDVSNHEMIVIRDDGIDRHIRFRQPDTIIYSFDLITWAGHLCITGDCGTYVFSRIKDMFEFFRCDDWYGKRGRGETLYINPGYWGEKLLSIGTNAGYKEFDESKFRDRVLEHYEEWRESEEPAQEDADELMEALNDEVLSRADDGELYAYQAAHDFTHTFFDEEGRKRHTFHLQDFFDGGGTERYTFHYLWCLYAIAWGVKQYDAKGPA